MLHILLLILKMIGILLLCLLSVLILGIVCVLFVPVRYQIEAVRKEGEKKPPVTLRVKVTWLLHFVNLVVRFDGSLFVRARLMVFTLFRLPEKEKKGRKRRREKGKRDRREETAKNAAQNQADTHRDESVESGSAPADRKTAPESAAQTDTAGNIADRPSRSTMSGAEKADKKPPLRDKLRSIPKILRGIFIKIKSLIENIQYTIQKFCDKIKTMSDTIGYYRGVMEGESFQRSFALCKGELLRIGKSLKPQKFQAQLVVGMDDPAATGQILAVCGMLYPLLGGHVDVAGDFERKRLEGHVSVKGKIRFFTFLRVAVKVYFNKDIRKLYKLLKKEAV